MYSVFLVCTNISSLGLDLLWFQPRAFIGLAWSTARLTVHNNVMKRELCSHGLIHSYVEKEWIKIVFKEISELLKHIAFNVEL